MDRKPATTPEATLDITDTSLELFLSLANDAGNWSGTPMADVTKQERGNLTQLKRAGLLVTFVDEGTPFAAFTRAGLDLAAQHDVDLSWVDPAFLATHDAPKAQKEDTMSDTAEKKQSKPAKPLTKAQIAEAEAAGTKLFHTRDGKVFTDRMARRAYRAANKGA